MKDISTRLELAIQEIHRHKARQKGLTELIEQSSRKYRVSVRFIRKVARWEFPETDKFIGR